MAYSPYKNYAIKQKKERQKEEVKARQKEVERNTVCEGIVIQKISAKEKGRLIRISKVHGLNFTNPCIGTPDMVLAEKRETVKERMNKGVGVEKDVYYYK